MVIRPARGVAHPGRCRVEVGGCSGRSSTATFNWRSTVLTGGVPPRLGGGVDPVFAPRYIGDRPNFPAIPLPPEDVRSHAMRHAASRQGFMPNPRTRS